MPFSARDVHWRREDFVAPPIRRRINPPAKQYVAEIEGAAASPSRWSRWGARTSAADGGLFGPVRRPVASERENPALSGVELGAPRSPRSTSLQILAADVAEICMDPADVRTAQYDGGECVLNQLGAGDRRSVRTRCMWVSPTF